MSNEPEPANDAEDEVIAKVSDYLDGLLSGADKDTVAAKIASDPTWKQTHDDMVETRKALSGLQKARAPGHFASEVTDTIRQRSRGAFFSRRDRVLMPLMVVAVLALCVIAYVMWSSQTGSLNMHHGEQVPHTSGSNLGPMP
jgi:anti-sigma factor RsiW